MTRIEDYDVLVACEESGMIRDALTAVGVRAISCDIKPTRRPGPHYHGDVRDILPLRHWRGLIAHPVCKFLANSGAKHLYRRIDGVWAKEHGPDPERWANMEAGAEFFNLFWNADHIPMRAVENSIMHGHALELTAGRPADQYTQPWWFGDPFTKAAFPSSSARTINRTTRRSSRSAGRWGRAPIARKSAARQSLVSPVRWRGNGVRCSDRDQPCWRLPNDPH
jgi:hypothetical protein